MTSSDGRFNRDEIDLIPFSVKFDSIRSDTANLLSGAASAGAVYVVVRSHPKIQVLVPVNPKISVYLVICK